MRGNKVETAVQCFRMSHAKVLAEFSGHSNSIYNIIPLLKKEKVPVLFFYKDSFGIK